MCAISRTAFAATALLAPVACQRESFAAELRIERDSVGVRGEQGSRRSGCAALSGDGRFVAFASDAPELVPDDSNECADVLLRDRDTGATRRVSVTSRGREADGESLAPALSSDGRFVVFASEAENLVPEDSNGCWDVFLHDASFGETRRVSVASNGGQGHGASLDPSLSGDGRVIAFSSEADDLVEHDVNGDVEDVFIHDQQSGCTTLVSRSSIDEQGNRRSLWPCVSPDGRFVSFASRANNLLAEADRNGEFDVFVRDVGEGLTERVSLGPEGVEALGGASRRSTLSTSGEVVAFESSALNLVSERVAHQAIYVRERRERRTELVSVAWDGRAPDGPSYQPSISSDGTFVLFLSAASNLVRADANGEIDVFVRDRRRGITRRVNVAEGGVEANAGFYHHTITRPSIAASGAAVGFACCASNLIPGDTNACPDVFVCELRRAKASPLLAGGR